MADIANIINVALLPEGQSVQRDNINNCLFLTNEPGVLNNDDRYRVYKSAAEVLADWGSYSETYQSSLAFFAQTPNPINAGGSLIIGYSFQDLDNPPTIPATATKLIGKPVDIDSVISQLQQINDGGFTVRSGATNAKNTTNFESMDFSAVATLDDILSVILKETQSQFVVSFNGSSFVITSVNDGAPDGANVGDGLGAGDNIFDVYPINGSNDDYVGAILGLSDEFTVINGKDEETYDNTDKQDFTTDAAEIRESIYFGAMVVDCLIDTNNGIANINNLNWFLANDCIIYQLYNNPNFLKLANNNTSFWSVKLAGNTNIRGIYTKLGCNTNLPMAYMARAHTVNFNAENSALTMNLETLNGIVPDKLTQTELQAAQTVGLDVYTTVKNVPVILCSGANGYQDNVYNTQAFINAVQTDVFNLLKTTSTKIPQTTKGVNQIIDQCEKTTRAFVKAGVFAPGTWSSPDTFGDVDVFKRSIVDNGYYWKAGELADQPQSDRQARKSPVIQGAVKNAGAIHSVDIIINLNY